MRHKVSRQRLSYKPDHANLLLRSLATSLILYESVRTTKKKAKVLQPIIDRLIATARKKEPRLAIREINKVVTHKNASRKIMQVLVNRYKSRSSGFTSLKAAGVRVGDGAQLVDLTLLDAELDKPVEQKEDKKDKKKVKKSDKRTAEAEPVKKEEITRKTAAEEKEANKKSISSSKKK